MDRRETLKSLLIGGVAGASITATGCKAENLNEVTDELKAGNGYGRTPSEVEHDQKLNACLLYTSPSPRDLSTSRMPSSA